jgi:hypothetical protein
MPKFKVVKVSVFSYKGKTYSQGDIVDINEQDAKRLTPSDHLQLVTKPEKPIKPEKGKK